MWYTSDFLPNWLSCMFSSLGSPLFWWSPFWWSPGLVLSPEGPRVFSFSVIWAPDLSVLVLSFIRILLLIASCLVWSCLVRTSVCLPHPEFWWVCISPFLIETPHYRCCPFVPYSPVSFGQCISGLFLKAVCFIVVFFVFLSGFPSRLNFFLFCFLTR